MERKKKKNNEKKHNESGTNGKNRYNIIDYIIWRGDLSFEASPFNEVDSLVISKLVNFDFTGIVLADGKKPISVQQAAELFFEAYERNPANVSIMSPEENLNLLKLCSQSVRFSQMLLSNYVKQIDEEQVKQFSALKISIDNSTDYIAFRGTDDTLVGWKENFNMSYTCPVASQISACEYVNKVEKGLFGSEIILGGHSKGGNLAIYSAVKCADSVKKRIKAVYSLDGPGFEKSFFQNEDYLEIKPKIKSIVPRSSLVGMLMDQSNDFEIVRSRKVGPMQHDAFMWDVIANRFVYVSELSASSKYWDKTIGAWVNDTPVEKRKEFIDWFFDLLYSTGATTFGELTKNSLSNLLKIVEGMKNTSKSSKEMAKAVIWVLVKECAMPITAVFPGKKHDE